VFFSPFVMVYLLVKAAGKVNAMLHSRAQKEHAAHELNRSAKDVPGFLRT